MVFTCLSLHLFSYPAPAGDQGSVQHLTLRHVPVDVFINLLSFFSEVKELKGHSIHPPEEVQCGLGCTSRLYPPITVQECFDNGCFCPAEN